MSRYARSRGLVPWPVATLLRLGKLPGFVAQKGLSIPRVKNYLGEDKMQEHDFELFTPDLRQEIRT